MEAKLTDPEKLRKILDALRDIVEEANLDCSESGLSLQAMDASHIALVSMNLDAGGFDKYKCENSTTLGVNLGAIQKILKCGDSNDTLTLQTSEDGSTLKFKFENSTTDRYLEFSMNLMDIDDDHLSIPEAEPDASIEMSCSDFQKACRNLNQFGDTVKISVGPSSVQFSVAGTTTVGSITFNKFESAGKGESQVDITCSEKIELSFALRYLIFFTKAAPLSDKVRLNLSADRPLLVQFDLEDQSGSIKYYLAPKVDDDDAAEE